MVKANIKTTINADIELVWDTVTSLENYQWRSDLKEIEILEDKKVFVEHTKDGFATKFEITKLEPLKRYEFNISNKNIEGNWSGRFESVDGKTVVDFTENISTKKLLLKPILKMYLKKQQAKYIRDLKLYVENK